MSNSRSSRAARVGVTVTIAAMVGVMCAALGVVLLTLLIGSIAGSSNCSGDAAAGLSGPAGSIALGPPGSGQLVGATEYGGPGDSGVSSVGARGDSLLAHPDSYAELGGLTWQTATAMGGLSYMTPLRITRGPN